MNALRQLVTGWLEKDVTISLASCVHFTGFRYGCQRYHPYETYLIELVRSGDLAASRTRFTRFLRHYRPRHLGEALGIELSREYPLWFFPWLAEPPAAAWLADPMDCPDILTHYSVRGIPCSRIHEEYHWLERALVNIRQHGFQPMRFDSPIRVRILEHRDGQKVHLVLDGNHRLSALSALGRREVPVRLVRHHRVAESELMDWPQVRNGRFTVDDARAVLRAFIEGNQRPETTKEPAQILEDVQTA